MTAKEITAQIFWRYRSCSDLIVPRFTPPHWWECDVFRLMENGYWSEYEIKLTAADFRADFAKEQSVYEEHGNWRCRTTAMEKKHDLLAAKDPRGPNRFWFVVSHDILRKVEIPKYAGVIVHNHGVYVHTAAPKLHNQKWQGDPNKVARTFYWRFWNQEAKAK